MINLQEQPIRVNENKWLLENIGRISVAKETELKGMADILAYSDDKTDDEALENLAEYLGGYIIENISESGVYNID